MQEAEFTDSGGGGTLLTTPLARNRKPSQALAPDADCEVKAQKSLPVMAGQVDGPAAVSEMTASLDPVASPDARRLLSASVLLLAIMMTIFMLRWAAQVLVPIMLGVTLSYALRPAVDRLEAWRVPRAIGAAFVMIALVATFAASVRTVREDATLLIESLPDIAQRFRVALRAERSQSDSPLVKVQQAANQLQQATKESAPPPSPERGVTRVQIEPPRFDLMGYVRINSVSMMAAAGEAVVVVFLAYFLLASGSTLRRKMMKIAGPSLARKKITLQGLNEVSEQIQRYLAVQVLVSVIVGIATWLAFKALGLEFSEVWGVAAFVLNFIPYLGSLVLVAGASIVAFVQFGTADSAFVVGGTATLLHVVTGHLLAPWLTSRASQLSALSVFLGVLVFAWLWGFWGLLLGVPTLMMIKALCDRIDGLKPIGELLGR